MTMNKIMTYETLRSFTYSNDHLIKGQIKGIVVEFFGLGGMRMYDTDPGNAIEYAEQGIVYLIPYNNPWNWMNKQAVDFTDEVIEVLQEKYSFSSDIKVVAIGGSMGGLSALVYTRYAKITPVACVANCPVCDLPYHYTERPDLPRTLYSAFGNYDTTLDEALKSASPLHLVDSMPDTVYTVFHTEKDLAVNIDKHSVKFVDEMKKNHNITFIRVPHRGHCDLSPEALVEYKNTILKAFN